MKKAYESDFIKMIKKVFKKGVIKYGDMQECEDEELISLREELMDYLETKKTQEFINRLHLLQEVERELTLREDR